MDSTVAPIRTGNVRSIPEPIVASVRWPPRQVILKERTNLCVASLHSLYPKTKVVFASAPSASSAAVTEACPIEHGLTKSGRYLLSRTSSSV